MTTVLEGGEGSGSRPDRSLPPGKTRYLLYRSLGGPQGRSGQVRKISPPTGIRSPDCPARSQSLYRLRYPAHIPLRFTLLLFHLRLGLQYSRFPSGFLTRTHKIVAFPQVFPPEHTKAGSIFITALISVCMCNLESLKLNPIRYIYIYIVKMDVKLFINT